VVRTIERRLGRHAVDLGMWASLGVACYARCQPGSFGFQSFLARVRAGAEVTASPWLAFTLNVIMAKSISVKRKKPGRPATGTDPLMGFRAAPAIRASIVRWAENQPDTPTLSEAIRRLVELGLKARPKA